MRVLAPLKLSQVPAFYDAYDDGSWVALLIEDIDGRTADHPWSRADADRVLAAVDELAEALTPSPWPDAPLAAVRSAGFLSGWDKVVANGTEVPAWLDGRTEEIRDLARRGVAAVAAGESLVHWDIRADNLLLTDTGRVVLVDWAWLARATPWADQVIVQGDIRTYADHPPLPEPPGDDVTGLIAAFAGGLWWASTQPDPPGLPSHGARTSVPGTGRSTRSASPSSHTRPVSTTSAPVMSRDRIEPAMQRPSVNRRRISLRLRLLPRPTPQMSVRTTWTFSMSGFAARKLSASAAAISVLRSLMIPRVC